MPILASLPMLCVCEKLVCSEFLTIIWVTKINFEKLLVTDLGLLMCMEESTKDFDADYLVGILHFTFNRIYCKIVPGKLQIDDYFVRLLRNVTV